MPSDRLIHLQNRVHNLYEQLAAKENALDTTPAEDKVRIQQQIDRFKKKDIQLAEQDYWLRLGTEFKNLTVPEQGAETIVSTIIQESEVLYAQSIYPDQLNKILQEILIELRKSEIPASGKLKAAIPLLPGFVTYEMELETGGLLRRIFPTVFQILGK
jgi:hypothetical protein